MTIPAADFEFVRGLVRDHSGISLGAGKEYLVEARLAAIAEREGVDSVSALIGRLRRSSPTLIVEIVGALATNETSFFRDVHPFDALRTDIIPDAVARGGGPHVWCAAASTGQEPYSVALLLATHFAALGGARIVATDLSDDVLTRAATGRYRQLEVNRGLPATMLVRWFSRHGAEWQLDERVRRLVTFRRLNLARPLPSIGRFDVVLLRNVLIYFDPELKARVLRAVASVMRPSGYLILGASETTYGIDDTFERVHIGKTVCYRVRDGSRKVGQ